MKSCYVLVNTEVGKMKETTKFLKTITLVKDVFVTWGSYDLVVKLEADNLEDLRECVTWKIRKIHAVRSTLTLIVNATWRKNA